MKTLFNILLSLSCISFAPINYAYCLYNNSDYPLEMEDTHLGGMQRTIYARDNACCDPKNFGCRGNMHIIIRNYYNERIFGPNEIDCEWKGNIKGTGHYFTVEKIYNSANSPCTITHHQD